MQLNKMNDGDLLAAFTEGNDKAFAEFYQRRRHEVYRYILSLTRGDTDLAHDMFQDTFIKIYEHAETLRDGSNIRGWICTIARNCCISHFRRSMRQVPFDDDRDDIIDSTLPSPDEALETFEMYTAVDEAIALLPDTQRDALLLREFKGHSYAEIARMTGTNINVVSQRLWRAKQTLRNLLFSRFGNQSGDHS